MLNPGNSVVDDPNVGGGVSEDNYVAFSQLHGVIANLPVEDRVDFLMALQLAPRLVLVESNPLSFLRYADWNMDDAGKRLALYWKRRREVFGLDRAFLPLILTGSGALSLEDVAVLRQGFIVFLPNDESGRTVLCIDTSRRLCNDAEARLRTIFYHGLVASENILSQTVGFVSLGIINDPKHDSASQACHNLITEVFPIRIYEWHYFNCTPTWYPSSFTSYMISWIRNMVLPFKKHVHTTHRREVIQTIMEKHGIGKQGLPDSLGGYWSYANFLSWLDARLNRELLEHPELTPSSIEGHSDSYKNFRELLESAMQQLPSDDTVAYYDSQLKAPPAIHDKECNTDLYLCFESFNAWLAAKRLSYYWKVRSSIFGRSAYSPLTQTGEGALRRKDISVLQTGFVASLPNDEQGSPVLWFDCSRLRPESSDGMNRRRCLFYMFSLLTEFEVSRTSGAVFVIRMNMGNGDCNDLAFIRVLVGCFPLRFKTCHFIFQEYTDNPAKQVINIAEECIIHNGMQGESLLEALQCYYFSKAGLPKCVGGAWDYGKFLMWHELRARMEWRIPIGSSIKDYNPDDFPSIKRYETLPESQKQEKERRMNVIHCRRKRCKKLLEAEALREQCDALIMHRSNLGNEGLLLANLLHDAEAHVLSEKETADRHDSNPELREEV